MIIRDLEYLSDPAAIEIIEGVPRAICLLQQHSFRVVVITNQSGVARGFFPESAVQEVNQSINLRLAEQGASIDGFYYCPHHIDGSVEQYRVACDCRKPKPGMLLRAARELRIDLSKSFMVGDKPSDVAAGHAAGMRAVMINSTMNVMSADECRPEFAAPNLFKAAKWIVTQDQ